MTPNDNSNLIYDFFLSLIGEESDHNLPNNSNSHNHPNHSGKLSTLSKTLLNHFELYIYVFFLWNLQNFGDITTLAVDIYQIKGLERFRSGNTLQYTSKIAKYAPYDYNICYILHLEHSRHSIWHCSSSLQFEHCVKSYLKYFHRLSTLGKVGHRVAMSFCMSQKL